MKRRPQKRYVCVIINWQLGVRSVSASSQPRALRIIWGSWPRLRFIPYVGSVLPALLPLVLTGVFRDGCNRGDALFAAGARPVTLIRRGSTASAGVSQVARSSAVTFWAGCGDRAAAAGTPLTVCSSC